MRLRRAMRVAVLVFVPAILTATSSLAAEAQKRARSEYDALAAATPSFRTVEAGALQRSGRRLHVEERLGVPSLLWAGKPGEPVTWDGKGKLLPAAAARRHLGAYARAYGLDTRDITAARLVNVHNTGQGAIIVTFRQQVDGVDVFRDRLAVVMDRKLRLVALSGYLPSADAPTAGFALGAEDAVAKALADFAGSDVEATAVAGSEGPQDGARAADRGGYEFYDLTPSAAAAVAPKLRLAQPVRAKQVLFHLPEGLEPAYYVEVDGQVDGEEGPDSSFYSYVISADGRRGPLPARPDRLRRVHLPGLGRPRGHARALRRPAGQRSHPAPHRACRTASRPPFVAPSLVTLQNGPISTNDPWLPAGADRDRPATTSTPTPTSPRPTASPPATCARPRPRPPEPSTAPTTPTQPPTSARPAARPRSPSSSTTSTSSTTGSTTPASTRPPATRRRTTTAAAASAATRIRAEAQDYSGTNNANMSTPADGGRPRMQMYVFGGRARRRVTVTAPEPSPAPTRAGTAGSSAPQSFDVTGERRLRGRRRRARDVHDGCSAVHERRPSPARSRSSTAAALVRRSRQKAQNAQATGAIGVIIANVSASATPNRAPGMAGAGAVTTPDRRAVAEPRRRATPGRAQVAAGATVSARLYSGTVDRDGTLDNADRRARVGPLHHQPPHRRRRRPRQPAGRRPGRGLGRLPRAADDRARRRTPRSRRTPTWQRRLRRSPATRRTRRRRRRPATTSASGAFPTRPT